MSSLLRLDSRTCIRSLFRFKLQLSIKCRTTLGQRHCSFDPTANKFNGHVHASQNLRRAALLDVSLWCAIPRKYPPFVLQTRGRLVRHLCATSGS